MLGEHIGTISGPTSMKAIAAVGGMPTFETTASGLAGTLAGADVTSFASYSANGKITPAPITSDIFCL